MRLFDFERAAISSTLAPPKPFAGEFDLGGVRGCALVESAPRALCIGCACSLRHLDVYRVMLPLIAIRAKKVLPHPLIAA